MGFLRAGDLIFQFAQLTHCLKITLSSLIAVALRLFFWRKISRPSVLIKDPTLIFQNIFQSLKIFYSKLRFPKQLFLISFHLNIFLLHLYQSAFFNEQNGILLVLRNPTVIQYITTPYNYFETEKWKSLRLLGTLRQFGTLE